MGYLSTPDVHGQIPSPPKHIFVIEETPKPRIQTTNQRQAHFLILGEGLRKKLARNTFSQFLVGGGAHVFGSTFWRSRASKSTPRRLRSRKPATPFCKSGSRRPQCPSCSQRQIHFSAPRLVSNISAFPQLRRFHLSLLQVPPKQSSCFPLNSTSSQVPCSPFALVSLWFSKGKRGTGAWWGVPLGAKSAGFPWLPLDLVQRTGASFWFRESKGNRRVLFTVLGMFFGFLVFWFCSFLLGSAKN